MMCGVGGWRAFLVEGLSGDGPVRLQNGEREHLTTVLRARDGARFLGLDGRGSRQLLRIVAGATHRFPGATHRSPGAAHRFPGATHRSPGAARHSPGATHRSPGAALELERDGPLRFDAPWGERGSAGAWVELACPLPKGSRADEWMDRLVQLGLSSYVDVVFAHSEVQARAPSTGRWARLERVAREALKQCQGSWLPDLWGPQPLESWLSSPPRSPHGDAQLGCLLDPHADSSLAQVLEAAAGREPVRALRIVAGPEGGFAPKEREQLVAAGYLPARLAAQVLRIETATELALGVARLCLDRAEHGYQPMRSRNDT